MASKDLRKVLQEEPNNAAATVGDQNMRNDQLVPADHISLTNESMGFRLMALWREFCLIIIARK